MAEDVILLLLVTQLVGIEADVLEHIAQLGDVGLFDRVQGLVDALAVARAVPLVVQGVEARVRRQDEAFALEHLGDQFRVITVLLLVAVVVVLPDVRDVLQEQHRQHKVFVDARVDGAAEGVAGVPDGGVDVVLADVRDFSHLCS